MSPKTTTLRSGPFAKAMAPGRSGKVSSVLLTLGLLLLAAEIVILVRNPDLLSSAQRGQPVTLAHAPSKPLHRGPPLAAKLQLALPAALDSVGTGAPWSWSEGPVPAKLALEDGTQTYGALETLRRAKATNYGGFQLIASPRL